MTSPLSLIRKKSIQLFIGFIILIIFCSSVTAFYNNHVIDQYQQKKNELSKIPACLDQVWRWVNTADMGYRGYALMKEEQFLEPYLKATTHYHSHLDSLAQYLEEQAYPDKELIQANASSIHNYINLVGHMVELARQGKEEEALTIFKGDPGYEVWLVYDKFNQDVLAYVNQLEQEAQQRYEDALHFSNLVQGILFLIGIPVLGLVLVRLRREKKFRHQLLQQLDDSNREFVYNDGHVHDSQDQAQVVKRLTNNLEKIMGFIRSITQDEKHAQWEEINMEQRTLNKGTLVGELLQMQDKMKQMKQEDEQRLWMTEGEGKVAEIARTHQNNLSTLGDQLIAYIVKYIQANQGGLFILNDDEPDEIYLSLAACYAYDKKKFVQKAVKPGQGLVGQVYLEKKTTCLNQVPSDYVRITSGLGEATPSYLVIIPLKFNDVVLGVLEIASFRELATFEISFLESVGEIIASSISIVRTNEQTQILLTQSREQAEEMRAQEEEMRQNMEELQATQEHYERLQHESLEKEKLLKRKLEELEEVRNTSD
ncbi:CHASE3 domain sensor protein [Catalinimonas alkaloidigena]|uniref:GAF domain-containing protein n=1 Tax=Catalinimonas alkaloidigena TaxID=1075417 RepID=UPI0024055859|nr:GAF domain-containing protein [Catalinimonas alkaloidigena]MDF9799415.1 CHASE3 domain sensor protein [Catalinimonas alkaloidigena]